MKRLLVAAAILGVLAAPAGYALASLFGPAPAAHAAAIGNAPVVTTPETLAKPQPFLLASGLANSIPCSGFEEIAEPLDAVSLGHCYFNGAEIVVATYESAVDASKSPYRKSQFVSGLIDVNEVVGANWSIACDDPATCIALEKSTGGKYVFIPAA